MICQNILRHRTCALSIQERTVLEGAITSTRALPAGQIVVRQDEPVQISILLVQGLMTRHVDSIDGRRHLVAVHVPGDFVDLHAYTLKKLDHDVATLTDVNVAVFTHSGLERIQAEQPSLVRRLWFCTLLDAAMHRQWIYRHASLNALQRMAHFLCETNARLMAIGISDGRSFPLPMTQADLGEVCGLTNVHVNRILRQLREMGLCAVRAGEVEIYDLPGLVTAGVFQPDYLYLDSRVAARAIGADWSSHE
ncbi:Crp/Fnr family transcriptional regulator [Rhodoferax koreense]|uniref:Crp/Fnr family transcriptional regulator n=1 Tax=Rhodoferax koreensis TaxID=1842727 RepID=A0A1P8JV32_9BURK|nr:Crp/Fnr family transcriptional regulator [Rhodoferax koreense]APW37607.1 Crp/Fnr family transcriptional regulator [Rhodoferax koreense]